MLSRRLRLHQQYQHKPVKTVKIVKSGELPVPEEGIHVEL